MPEFGVGQNGNPWHYSYTMLSPAQKLLALDSIITNEVLPSEELDDHTVLNYTILRRMINQSVEASADDLLRLEEKVMEWASASGVSGPLFSEENVYAPNYTITTFDRVVYIFGTAGSNEEMQIVMNDASDITGVKRVVNLIEVKPNILE